jgi:N utilization substance protein A
MMFEELAKVIEQFGKDKGIDRKMVQEAIEIALVMAAKKKLGPHVEIEAQFNDETNEVELFQFKTVVEDDDVADPDTEIELAEAQKDDPDVELGDSIGVKLDAEIFGRIAAQTAKQVINQKIRDAEREIIYSEFLARKGEIISGIVRRFERVTVVVDLGKTEAYMPVKEQIPGEQYRIGDRIQAYLLDVQQTTRGPQIILSRATPLYLIKLFEMEVPEIYEGIVTIKSAARDPGARAKIAVSSRDKDVDPVGACVGVRGARVQNIVSELKGERIDIVPYNEDIAKFACSALAPAEVSKVLIDEDNKFMEVVVPDTQLSLAIGKRGQNVRLAAQLTGWKIDVMGETGMSQRYDDAKFSLTQVPGITDTLATLLFQNGYKTIFEIAEAKTGDILGIPGFDNEDNVNKIIEAAKTVVASGNVIVKNVDEKFTVVEKKTADQLLREEMQMLLKKEQSANAEAVSDLLDVKGVGPSMVKAMNEAGITNTEGLAGMEESTLLGTVNWENKDELKAVHKEAVIAHKESLIKAGKLEGFNEEEKQRLLEVSGLSNSVLLRLAACGLNSIKLIKASSLEDFTSLNAMPNEKAEEVYNAVKSL